MAHGDAWEGKWRGNWRMEWADSTLHTTSEHGLSSITIADAHTSAASSRLNWRPLPIEMDSYVSPKDEIWFLGVCHHISNAVYKEQIAEFHEPFTTAIVVNWGQIQGALVLFQAFFAGRRMESRQSIVSVENTEISVTSGNRVLLIHRPLYLVKNIIYLCPNYQVHWLNS
jgi:hypothetical protein